MKIETVAECFATYRAAVIPADAPAVQVTECERAFYAGAYFLLMNLSHNVGDDETSEDEGVENLERLRVECEAYAAAAEQPRPTPEPPPPLITVPDARYTTSGPELDQMRPVLQLLARLIDSACLPGWGFNLLLFQFGPGGQLLYISNAQRQDVIELMREYIPPEHVVITVRAILIAWGALALSYVLVALGSRAFTHVRRRKGHAMTMDEIADTLDTIAVDMSNALMPRPDDPQRAPKAYALGIAAHAIRQRAEQLRKLVPRDTVLS